MQMSIMLLEQILAMLLMALAGYALAKVGIANSQNFRIISQLMIYVIYPATIVNSFCTRYEPAKLEGLLVTAMAALLVHIVYLAVTALLCRTRRGLIPEEQASVIYSNAGNLVLPLVAGALGQEYVFYASSYIMVQTLFIWTHGYHIMGSRQKTSLKEMLLNPCILSIAVGLCIFLSRVELHPTLGSALSGLAACIGPLSMITIGVLLAETDLKAALAELRLYRIVFLRLILYPLLAMLVMLVIAFFWQSPDEVNILTVSLLGTIGPTASLVVQISQLMDSPEKTYASSINAVTTILCVVTIPVLCGLFQAIL